MTNDFQFLYQDISIFELSFLSTYFMESHNKLLFPMKKISKTYKN